MRCIDTGSTAMAAAFKQEAHKLIDQLPETASWDDLMHQAALRASVERGLADIEARRVIPVEALMKEFGVAEA